MVNRYGIPTSLFEDHRDYGDGWDHLRDALDQTVLPDQIIDFIKKRPELRNQKPSLNLLNQALATFLLSGNAVLTRSTRLYIASLLQRLYFSDYYSLYQKNDFSDSVQKLKDVLQKSAGLAATRAEEEIAGELGVTVEALRKRLQRTRRSVGSLRQPT